MECWKAAPDDRPCFKELHTTTSKYTERIAGYLEIGFNPFGGATTTCSSKEHESKDGKDELECTVSIQVIPPSEDASEAHSALINNTD